MKALPSDRRSQAGAWERAVGDEGTSGEGVSGGEGTNEWRRGDEGVSGRGGEWRRGDESKQHCRILCYIGVVLCLR